MPRITAASVAEHVRIQEAAVVDAAVRLFTEHGVRNVQLGDIAAEVGLARTSIYRYFPDKGHILAAWFRRAVTPLEDQSRHIAESDAPAAERVEQWVAAQFDALTSPEHAAMLVASAELVDLTPDLRAELGAAHDRLYAPLRRILDESLASGDDAGSTRDAAIITTLLAAIVRSAAEQARTGADGAAVRAELLAVAGAIVRDCAAHT